MWPESLEDIAERLAMINYWSLIMGTFLSVWNNKDICMQKFFYLYKIFLIWLDFLSLKQNHFSPDI